jgi:hypothetical protein
VLARDLQLTPGPQDLLLASAGQGPPELLQSFYRTSIELLWSFYRTYTELARDLDLLTPRTPDLLASADQGPPAYSQAEIEKSSTHEFELASQHIDPVELDSSLT